MRRDRGALVTVDGELRSAVTPRRRTCTRASAASFPRWPRAGTSSSCFRSSARRSSAAGAGLDDLEAVAVTQGPGLIGALLVGALRRQGPRLGARPAARAGQPLARTRRLALPRAGPARAALPLPAGERRAHAAGRRAGAGGLSRDRDDASTTRPAKPSTRARGCSGSATPAAPRSTGSRVRAIRRRMRSRSPACPGSTSRSRG